MLKLLLQSPEPTIEEFIITVLHDSVEEIDGYTLEHIEKNY
jgi:hypothetical protein